MRSPARIRRLLSGMVTIRTSSWLAEVPDTRAPGKRGQSFSRGVSCCQPVCLRREGELLPSLASCTDWESCHRTGNRPVVFDGRNLYDERQTVGFRKTEIA